jgi:hypothetical protein
MPRHCHIRKNVTAQETKTYVLRSIGSGMMRVQTRLKAGRAITECCTPNKVSSNTSIRIALLVGPETVESIDLNIKKSPTKPAIQANVPTKSK